MDLINQLSQLENQQRVISEYFFIFFSAFKKALKKSEKSCAKIYYLIENTNNKSRKDKIIFTLPFLLLVLVFSIKIIQQICSRCL